VGAAGDDVEVAVLDIDLAEYGTAKWDKGRFYYF